MREIKFRAWDKRKQAWIFPSSQEVAIQISPKRDLPNFELWPNYDIVLMQYTGLKDKNGREIYEGDVLSFPTEDGRDRFLDIIYNAEYGEFCPVLRSTNWQPVLRFILDSGAYVIGNIHENPSLLKPISGGL